jgi:hypothetical protein
VLDIYPLPTDVPQLQWMLVEHRALIASQSVDLRTQQRQIEHLKFPLAELRRRFGHSSEQMPGLEALVASAARAPSLAAPAAAPNKEQP